MELEIFPPLTQFDNVLLHTLWIRLATPQAFIPAGLSPSIMLFVRGGASVLHKDGRRELTPRFFLRGPFVEPVHALYEPGTVAISVCFIPGMLGKACKVAVADIVNRVLAIDEIFDPIVVQNFLSKIDSTSNATSNVRDFHDFLQVVLKPNAKSLISDAFLAAHKKIFLPIMELSLHFGIGERQLERRVRSSFGVSLRDIRRFVRCGFTMERIIKEQSAWGDLTQLAQDSGYYDQAHMHKEFAELVGISPNSLLQRIAAKDPAYWMHQLSPQQFKQLFNPVE